MDISVIIVNYNTCALTRKCVDSIFAYSHGVQYEVIVVDNDSRNDDSKLVLSQYPGIRYVQADSNLGFGRANNLGYSLATGRYILFLNSDTYLLNDALKAFVEGLDNLHNEVACVGAQLLSEDGAPNNSYSNLPTISWYVRAIANLYLTPFHTLRKQTQSQSHPEVEAPFEVPYIIGADLCVRRDVIERCGLFDSDFFMYYEDSELQARYHRMGYKSMIIPSPRIVHLECASSRLIRPKQYSAITRKWFLQSQALYFQKVYSAPVYWLYRILSILSFPLYLRSYYTGEEKRMLMHTLFNPTKASNSISRK